MKANSAALEKAMNCPKCGGYMYVERFADFALTFYAWKCINCGTVTDSGVAENKRGQERPVHLVEI